MNTIQLAYKNGVQTAVARVTKVAGLGSALRRAAAAAWQNRHVALPLGGAALGLALRGGWDKPWNENLMAASLGALSGGALALGLINKGKINAAIRQALGNRSLAQAARETMGDAAYKAARRRMLLSKALLGAGALTGIGYYGNRLYNRGKQWIADTKWQDIAKRTLAGMGTGALAGGVGGYIIDNDPSMILQGAAIGAGLGGGAAFATHPKVMDVSHLVSRLV